MRPFLLAVVVAVVCGVLVMLAVQRASPRAVVMGPAEAGFWVGLVIYLFLATLVAAGRAINALARER